MRLTLRTLLAWLDDKLPPAEVREIGRQVADSAYAKELVERIHKVTRQRRLTVPASTGPDATDENLVASYIDNELDPEYVAEFEKKCLMSDVHLAEVSSVHQILSLIGQKARVPNEARLRMYQLVKGREATRPKGAPVVKLPEVEPIAQPIQPWVTPPPPDRPLYQQYGPAALVLGLMAVLGSTAWLTLSQPEPGKSYGPPLVPTGPAPGASGALKTSGPIMASTLDVPRLPDAPSPAGSGAIAADATKATTEAAAKSTGGSEKPAGKEAEKDAEKTSAPGADIPAGSVGLAKKPSGVLLRYNSERRDWDRLTDAAGLSEQDRVLSLDPFRATIEVGSADVDLVRETEVWVKSTPKTQAARLALAQGRVVLHGNPSGLPFEVQSGNVSVTVATPPNVAVGVERVNRRATGEATATAPSLRVYAADGPVVVASGGASETLEVAGWVTVGPDGKLTDKVSKPAPAWVTETSLAPFDQKIGEQFLQFFRPDRPIVSSLVEASEDEQKDVCRLAISALRAVGDISYIVPLLNKRGDASAPTARRAAIGVLRSYLDQGPEAAKALRAQLQRDLGDDLAKTTEKLLVGYSPKDAADEATFARLVELLGTTDAVEVGVRELALDNLRQLTGRDDLDYDPEKPEGKGLKAWRDLLKNHELKVVKPGNSGK